MEELSTPTMRERLVLALQAKKITAKPGPRGDGFEVELIEEDGDDKMLVDVDDLTPYGEEWTLTLRFSVGVDDGEAAERAAQLVERVTNAEEWKADRDMFEDGSNAVDLIWDALNAAGVCDVVDNRQMVQVSEDEADVIGECRQADVLERVGFLADDRDALVGRVAELEAENALLRLPVGIESAAMALALRRIAAVVGAPAGLGPLADLDGLVQFVRSRATSGGTP